MGPLSFKKFLLILGGLAAGLLLSAAGLELALRVYGSLAERPRTAGTSSKGRTVLCAGDSFVYGVGGTPFPQQLEDILNTRQSALKFRVINAGEPGTGTSQMLAKLPAQLQQHKPDYLILLSGVSNKWTQGVLDGGGAGIFDGLRLMRFWRILRSMKRTGALDQTTQESCPDNYPDERLWLDKNTTSLEAITVEASPNSHTLRLHVLIIGAGFLEIDAALTRHDLKSAETAEKKLRQLLVAPPPPSEDIAVRTAWQEINKAAFFKLNVAHGNMYSIVDHKKSVTGFEEAIRLRPDYLFGYLNIMGLYRAAGDSGNFLKYAALLRAKAPDFAPQYLELSWFYWLNHEADKSFEAFGKALELAPCSEHIFTNAPFSYSELAPRIAQFEKLSPRIRSNQAYGRYKNLQQHIGQISGQSEASMIENIITRDLTEAGALARRNGAVLIMSSYPYKYVPGVESASRQLNAEYIDFVPKFSQRFSSPNQYLAFDKDHCNSDGYRFMAETYADAILSRETNRKP